MEVLLIVVEKLLSQIYLHCWNTFYCILTLPAILAGPIMQLDVHDDKVYQDHLSSQAATALSYSYLMYRDLMDCNPVFVTGVIYKKQ